MPLMASPYVPKPVDVPDVLVDRYRESGFSVVKPVVPVEPPESKPARKRKSSK